MIHAHDFYRDERVIKRMLEYCGVPCEFTKNFQIGPNFERYNYAQTLGSLSYLQDITQSMSTEYLVGWGKRLIEEHGREFESVYNEHFGRLLDLGLDVFRAIWDRRSTVAVMDVEYFSKKFPGAAYAHQEAVYERLEPFHRAMMSTLRKFGINPLVVATGQGYHYSFRVANDSPVASELERLGQVDSSVLWKYLHPSEKRKRVVPLADGRRYDTIGKLLEFITHEAIRAREHFGCDMPVTIGDIVVGNQYQETINVDLSAFANPVFMRDVRLPFSTHHKHKVQIKKVGREISEKIPVQIAIPRYTPCNNHELPLHELFRNRRHFENSANYAGAITTDIPESSRGVARLIEAYLASRLYRFHREFEQTEMDDPRDWYRTYDRFNLRSVPPCVANIVETPNPFMLQPTQIQTLVRVLTSKGWWHPKHVAGLIRSKYEREHGWEVNWDKYDANMWACVWTRFYYGLIVNGLDRKIDLNCVSHQEKGLAFGNIPYCVQPNCGYNLQNY
jgi:hypothetical protein